MPDNVRSKATRIYTIGHANRPLDRFIAILQSFAIDLVVDVRTIPRSRYNPQFNQETLPWRCHRSLIADTLPARGIRVVHLFKEGESPIDEFLDLGIYWCSPFWVGGHNIWGGNLKSGLRTRYGGYPPKRAK